MYETSDPASPTRRGFLDWLISLFSTVAGAAMLIPGVLYLWPAAKGGKAEDVEVKGADALKPDESTITQVRGKAVIIRRDASGLVAYSAVCPHLGCLVKWDGARKVSEPCHAAVFDSNGGSYRVRRGPASAVQVKEVGGKVYVSST